MPLPLIPLIAAGSSIISNGINSLTQGGLNRRQQEFSLDMYNRQRADSLADWNMQNEYNSPAAQMERFKAAGLNPNLIYGQNTVSPSVRSSSVPSWNPTNPNYGSIVDNTMQSYMQMMTQKQALSNMEWAGLKTAAEIANLGQRTASGAWKLGADKELFDLVKNTAEQKLYKTTAEAQYMGYKRDILQNTAEMQIKQANELLLGQVLANSRTAEETKRISQAIELMKKDGALKDFEMKLNQMGITKGDSTWLRMFVTFLGKFGITF